MADFKARSESELGKIAKILGMRGIDVTYCMRVDPDKGHSTADVREGDRLMLFYRAKSVDELSRQLEAVRTTLELLESAR